MHELSEADEIISTKSAIHHFIFNLGTEFVAIQNNFHIGLLPSEWHTQDWPTLLVLCRDYYHLVNPQDILKCDLSHENGLVSQADQAAQHEAVVSQPY